jgi:hypothetical protein
MGDFRIELTHDRPIFEPPRRHSALEHEIQDAKCIEMRDASIIRPAAGSKYACNTTMPAKKDVDGNWTDKRFCIDLRPINEATVTDAYRLHIPEEMFRDMAGSRIFSCIDCRAGFVQLPVDPES